MKGRLNEGETRHAAIHKGRVLNLEKLAWDRCSSQRGNDGGRTK